MNGLKIKSVGGPGRSGRVVITDPDILVSLRPSDGCMKRCEELERMTMPRRGRWFVA